MLLHDNMLRFVRTSCMVHTFISFAQLVNIPWRSRWGIRGCSTSRKSLKSFMSLSHLAFILKAESSSFLFYSGFLCHVVAEAFSAAPLQLHLQELQPAHWTENGKNNTYTTWNDNFLFILLLIMYDCTFQRLLKQRKCVPPVRHPPHSVTPQYQLLLFCKLSNVTLYITHFPEWIVLIIFLPRPPVVLKRSFSLFII